LVCKELCQLPVADMPTLQEVLKERYDDARGGAQGLGQLKKTRTIKGFIGAFDLVDHYRVKLTGRSSLAASLSNMEGNIKIRILDSTGASVAKSKKASITKTLDAGVYFIQVSRRGTSTNYTLNASVSGGSGGETPGPSTPGNPGSAPTDASDPGNFPAKALDVGKLDATSKSYKGAVGGADTGDFFRFTLDKPNQFSSIVSGVAGGEVETSLVYDINGNGLVDSGDKITEGVDIAKSLGAGSYFIAITPKGTGTNISYNLKLSATAIAGISPAADPSLGLGNASNLGTISGIVNVKQLVGSTDSTDIYKFTLTGVSNFSTLLNSTQRTGDVTMSLIYDEENDGIADPQRAFYQIDKNGEAKEITDPGDFIGGVFTDGSGGGSALAINKTLGAGTYYLAVTQRKLTDNSTYDLSLFVNNTITGINPATDPGSDLNTATNLGTLSSPINVKQFVGSVDRFDTYKFTLNQERNIIINYNGSPELAVLRLGKDLNNNGLIDFNLSEDGNNNGILDLDKEEDLNGNGILNFSEVYEPEPTTRPLSLGRAVYAPLPPYFNSESKFVFEDNNKLINGFRTTVPTAIYAKLPAGTYFLQVDAQGVTVDLGDPAERSGSANILYNLSLQLDG
jgi:hypothetical protein